MSPRIFFGWLVVTTVTVVLALFVVLGRPTSTFDPLNREAVFPNLQKEAVAKLLVKSRFGTFTLVRNDDGKWSTPDRFDYPVDESHVYRLVAAMSDMHYIERKTSRPDRFARLEVDDITGPESESAYVKISSADGDVLAETIVGRPSARFIDGSSSGTYIRIPPDSNNTWLVSSVANVQTRLIPWLQRTIVSMPANTVARIQLKSGDAALTLSRPSADKEAFAIDATIPKGKVLNDRKVTTISKALAKLDLEDVKPRTELQLPADAATATVTTFDGVAVTVQLAMIDKKPWATFAATYTGDPADQSKAAQAARETVAKINQRVGKWAYWLPSATFDSLTSKLDDVLEAKKDKKGSS